MNETLFKYCISRFTFTSEILNIENVQMSDSGTYFCKKTIIIPPPSTDAFTNVTLHVEDLSLERLKSNSSCIHLLCSWESVNPEPVNFTWFRKGHDSLLFSSVGNNSTLYLCQPAWEENDTFTCQASINQKHYNRSIELNPSTEIQNMWPLIIGCSAAAGVIASLIFTAIICKCRKRRDSSGSFIFTNKVYENFSFAMARQTSPPAATPQTEDCIYEN
ncbi:uncharacterized protein [Misgurnus anguillicaudatus]|uniref:uncharacterized protein isoform X2 n=1 Tax=Misgurnus anguillicaudatus TaxID=75329 RepID=UPI003CCF2D93